MPDIDKTMARATRPVASATRQSATLAERLQHVVDDRRGVHRAVPIDLGRYLNDLQLLALHSLENFGWHLWFVRRPLFLQPLVVVINPDSTQHAVLEGDGSVNLKPHLQIRL